MAYLGCSHECIGRIIIEHPFISLHLNCSVTYFVSFRVTSMSQGLFSPRDSHFRVALKEAVLIRMLNSFRRSLRLGGIVEQLADEVGLFEVLAMDEDEGETGTDLEEIGRNRQFDLTAELEEIIAHDANPADPRVLPAASPTPPLTSYDVAGEPGVLVVKMLRRTRNLTRRSQNRRESRLPQ